MKHYILLCCHYCHATQSESDINWAEWFTAGATVALAGLTIYLVKAALQQLKDIREGIEVYASAAESNEKLNLMQSAENTIMKQIEFHYKLLDGIKLSSPDGQQAFPSMYRELTETYNTLKAEDTDLEKEKERVKLAFEKLYETFGSQIGNYYKNLYYLVKYIHDLDEKKGFNKTYYFNLVKAQLSKFELLLLAYNSIWINLVKPKSAGENFIDYIGTHNLLSALETKHLMNRAIHIDLFKSFKVNFDDQKKP